MADTYYVRPNTLIRSANQLASELQAFRAATEKANKAANDLSAMWEGDTQKAFCEQQAERAELYLTMQNAMENFQVLIRAAANRYANADYTGAQLLRTK